MPSETNSRNSEIPVMISPFRIGMVLMKPIAFRLLALRLKIPMAATLPSKVDTVAAISAMAIVLTKAFIKE